MHKEPSGMRIIIVGCDAAAWLSACTLSAALRDYGAFIGMIELPTHLTAGQAYATPPSLEGLHALIGVEEANLLRQARGLYSLGQEFVNFGRKGTEFFLPFSEHGAPIEDVPFAQLWLHGRTRGLKVGFDQFSLNTQAARRFRFFKPDATSNRLQQNDYAYHLAAPEYVALLRDMALAGGVAHHLAQSLRYDRDPASGDIRSILVDGLTIEGDLFIDASGPESLLLGVAAAAPRTDLGAKFSFSRHVSAVLPRARPLPPFSQSRASLAGLTQFHALADSVAVRHAYSPDHVTEQDVASWLTLLGAKVGDGDLFYEDRPAGHHVPWTGNVLGIGAASASLDMICDPELQLIHHGLVQFLRFFPRNADDVARARKAYNDRMIGLIEQVVDFQQMHYRLNQMSGSKVWDRLRQAPASDRLQARLATFKRDGTIAMAPDEPFRVDDWLGAMIGHGLQPAAAATALRGTSDAQAMAATRDMLAAIQQQVQDMGSLDTLIEDL